MKEGAKAATIPAARAVTLKQVAAAAGVHPSTVSRTLNPSTRHLVAEAVALRVAHKAQELDYRPDLVAASLRTGRSKLIGVVVPDIADPVWAPILDGIAEALGTEGYSTIIADIAGDQERQFDFVDRLIARRVDGLVLATVRRDDPVVGHCVVRSLPVVLVNRREASPRVSAVVSDDASGMRMAVDHLVDLGHRRIGHLAGPQHISTGFLRREGFAAAVAAHGLPAADCPIEIAAAYSRQEGARASQALFAGHPDLTAVVAANDLLALGAYDALRKLGRKCPEDISVVGHNDMPLVDMVAPPLTTVRIGHREMGQEAARLLLYEIAGTAQPKRTITLAPTLVVRSSTSRPRQR